MGHISFCCYVDAVNFFDRNINTVLKKSYFILNRGVNPEVSVEETKYEGSNFSSGNYLFTTDTK